MKLFLKTKDFSVSGEDFELLYDSENDMLVTHPQPMELTPYYDSEVYISHTDAKASFVDNVYQRIKRYSLRKKLQLIDNQKINLSNLLDLGAGTGDFLAYVKQQNVDIQGVEPNEKARFKAKEKGVDLYKDMQGLGQQTFDAVTLWHVLEHLPNLDEQIKDICARLNKDGILVVAVPNYKSFDAKFYGSHWAAYDVPRHLWHFSKKSITALFAKEKMKVISIKPMLFDSFYVAMLSEKYKKNKLYLINAFFIGLWSNIKAYFSGEYSSLIYILKKEDQAF